MSNEKKSIFDYLGVAGYAELMEYMRDNPNDPKVERIFQAMNDFVPEDEVEAAEWNEWG